MSKCIINKDTLETIANAIREKTGKTDPLSPTAMPTEISQIETGVNTSDATALASDMLSGKTAYVNGEKITGTIPTKTSNDLSSSGATITVPAGYYASDETKSVATTTRANTTISTTADDTNDKLTITASNNQGTGYVTGANKTATTTISLTASGATVTASDGTNKVSKSVATATQATPSISFNNGLITASSSQSAGYVSGGTTRSEQWITTLGEQWITPTTYNQYVHAGRYLTGNQTIAGDGNLVAGNIKQGVSIFGVTGNYGGVKVNFNVVGGEYAPSNPAANTIWINTNIGIPFWEFISVKPTWASSTGQVYIVATTSTNNMASDFSVFASGISGNMWINPLAVFQYDGSSWIYKSAMIYKNNSWIPLDTFLFNSGNEFESLTGGWSAFQPASNPYDAGACSKPTGLLKVQLSGQYNGSAALGTNNKIDLTNFSAIEVTVDAVYSSAWFSIAPERGTSALYSGPTRQELKTTGTHHINISTITSSYYVLFGASTGDAGRTGCAISKIRLIV